MRAITRLSVIGILILCASFEARAQNQDRDSSRIPKTSANGPGPEDRVDINHARLNELLKVPGMTPSWAGRIIRYRPYHAKSDLLQRGVVPDAVYDRIKDFIITHRNKR